MPPNQNNANPGTTPNTSPDPAAPSNAPIGVPLHANRPDKNGYYRLGRTTLYYLLLKYSLPAIGLILIELILLGTAGGGNTLPPISEWASSSAVFAQAIQIAVILVPPLIFGAAAFAFVIAYFWYISFRYKLEDNDLAFEKGLISRQEISIPFRQIQNADIEQSVIYRIFNLADLVILTAGHEDPERATENETEIVMPALNLEEARRLQEYLLDRANVQKIVAVSASTEPTVPPPLE